MKYDTILFDLDGTITDSAPGILASVEYALSKFWAEKGEKRVYDRRDLNFFIGPPLIDSFERLLGCTHEESGRCLVWYREFYVTQGGMLMNSVYPRVAEVLAGLKASGRKILLATAKPEIFARRILEHFGLLPYFDDVHGATLDESRNRKAGVVAWALAHSGELGRAIMVGDRADDVKGAAENGLETIGALWGYGSREELLSAGAVALCERIDDLPGMV